MRQSYSQVPLDRSKSTLQQSRASSVALDGGTISRSPKAPSVTVSREHHLKALLCERAPDYKEAKPKHPHLYQPLWLTKPLFAVLILLFTILWVALIILWHVSLEDGLSLKVTSSHYAWTYGPTVILVVILSIWRQVDYHCKLTQPWREMISTHSIPQRSLLLDYISPMQVVGLYKSLRQRHYPVVLSVAGFIVLKLVILVSTTLFVPKQTLHLEARPIQYTASFNASTLWSKVQNRNTTTDIVHYHPEYVYLPTNSTTDMLNFTTDMLWGYLNQLNGQASDPTRVKDNMILQSFTSPVSKDNITSITAAIDVFTPSVTCEAAEVGLRSGNISDEIYLTIDTDTCSIGHDGKFSLYSAIPGNNNDNESTLVYGVKFVNCFETIGDSRFIIAALDANITTSFNIPVSTSLIRTSAVVCKMDFSIGKADSTLLSSGNSVELTNLDTDAGTPIDLNSTELSRVIYTVLYDGWDIQIETDLPITALPDEWRVMFLLMHKYLGLPTDWDGFFDQDKLEQAATSVFQGLALQLGTSQLLQPANMDGIGSVTVSQNKLFIRTVPLIIMIVCFAFMTCLAVVSMLLLQKKVIPQSQGSIASYATILARSPSLAEILNETGSLRTSALHRKLHGLQFKALPSDQGYSIDVTNLTREPCQSISSSKVKSNDWIPFAARTPMFTLIFLSPLIVIAGLEVFQMISNTNNGVVGLANGDYDLISYATRYGSTLVILLVATLFNNLDFTITTFTPFSALLSATTSSEISILVNLIGETPTLALSQCFRYRYFGTTLSMIAALLGSILPIIVSGLWKADNKVMMSTGIIAETGSWNLTWTNSSGNDNGAARLLNTIDHGGAVEPKSIWEDLVLPNIAKWSFATNAAPSEANNMTSDFEFTIHSLRPELVFTVASQENIRYNSLNVSVNYTKLGLNYTEIVPVLYASFQLPTGCWTGSPRNSSTATLEVYPVSEAHRSGALVSVVYDIDAGPAESNSTLFDATSNQLLNSTGCPSLGFIFGYFENATALLCSQKIQEVPMQVSYQGDPLVNLIDPQRPPSVSNSTTPEYAIDPATGFPTHQYRIGGHLDGDLTPFGQDFNTLFDHLLNGPFGIQRDSILGHDKADNLIAAINTIYNKYMTLVIDMNFRLSPSITNATSSALESNVAEAITVNCTMTQQVTRLKMNNASKLTLQIMLGIMTLFMAVAVKMVKIRRTLPRSPYSIVSVMGFLAGSKICDPKENFIPPGSEFLRRKELARLFEGRTFSLGWWTSSAGQEVESDAEHEVEVAASESDPFHEWHELMPTGSESSVSKAERFGIDVAHAGAACSTNKVS